ncbi:MAG: TauD/TfdA family dioxygenase [Betaproteobacteria bacterium]|nr:TauD/TfdA family dioxygenase [Betaproteobacteria bacterium]
MAVSFVPLHPLVGAEVKGLDLRNPMDEATHKQLQDAFSRYFFLLVRDQKLEKEDQERYSLIFGDIEYRTAYDVPRTDPRSQYVSNTRTDGILGNGELYFHQDQTFFADPMIACTLYAIEIPSSGGDTLFANSGALYDSLPEDYRSKLDGLTSLHVFDYGRDPNAPMEDREIPASSPRCIQPVVWIHPKTGRKSLWVNHIAVDHIHGMSREEGKRIVLDLAERIANPELYYRHQWRVGDIVMWDNLQLQHMRENFDASQPRTLRRMPLLSKYRADNRDRLRSFATEAVAAAH